MNVTTADAANATAKKIYNAIQSAGVKFDLPPVLDYESKSGSLSVAVVLQLRKHSLQRSNV